MTDHLKANLRQWFVLFEAILVGIPALCAVGLWLFESMGGGKNIFIFCIVMGFNMYFLPVASVCPSAFKSGEFVLYPKNMLGIGLTLLFYTVISLALAWLTTKIRRLR